MRCDRARHALRRRLALLLCSLCVLSAPVPAAMLETGTGLAALYEAQVDRRLELPEAERRFYAARLAAALFDVGLYALPPEYFVLVDQDPRVQAIMVYWLSPAREFEFVGASPCSTGRPGQYEHFYTPTGVFEHTVANLDFRAEGTKNAQGIRGYGMKGMRVYDFGWVQGERGWGRPAQSSMRLQIHSTDPDLLEPRLGLPHSKGCIRIPATLNQFLDRYGILDADYEHAMAEGKTFWVLRPDREPTPWSGRYLVVIDSNRSERPGWASVPPARR